MLQFLFKNLGFCKLQSKKFSTIEPFGYTRGYTVFEKCHSKFAVICEVLHFVLFEAY